MNEESVDLTEEECLTIAEDNALEYAMEQKWLSKHPEVKIPNRDKERNMVVSKMGGKIVSQKIDVPLSEEDLQELMNNKEFNWTFDGIDVHLFKQEEQG